MLSIKRGDEINVEYSKNEIINKINSYFGYKLVNEIKVQTLNFQNKKLVDKKTLGNFKNFDKKINTIKNDKIRNSLSQLLKTIKNV